MKSLILCGFRFSGRYDTTCFRHFVEQICCHQQKSLIGDTRDASSIPSSRMGALTSCGVARLGSAHSPSSGSVFCPIRWESRYIGCSKLRQIEGCPSCPLTECSTWSWQQNAPV